MNLMLLNVSTRKFRRAVQLPEADVPAPAGSGLSKSALCGAVERTAAGMVGGRPSKLDLLVLQIDDICLSTA